MAFLLVDKNQNGSYLAHHGVKGQKWGERHGPPYPLSRQKAPDNPDRIRGGNNRPGDFNARLKQIANARVLTAKKAKQTTDSYDRLKDYERKFYDRNAAWDTLLEQYDNSPEAIAKKYEDSVESFVDAGVSYLRMLYGSDRKSVKFRKELMRTAERYMPANRYSEVLDDVANIFEGKTLRKKWFD